MIEIRTRNASLTDFGVPEEDQKKLYERCRKLNKEERLLLLECAISSTPGIEVCIYDSLVNGIGYDAMGHNRYIPVKEMIFTHIKGKRLLSFITSYFFSGNGEKWGTDYKIKCDKISIGL